MTDHIQKNTLSDLDSPVFIVEDELIGSAVQRRCEKGNEILFTDSGTIFYTVGEKNGALIPGVCMFLQEADEYTLFCEDACCVIHRIMLNPVLMDDLFYPYEAMNIQMLVSDKQVSRLVCQLYDELSNRRPYYEWVARGKLQELYGYLYRNGLKENNCQSCEDSEVVQQILSYLKNNFRKKIHLDKLCADIGYSKYYACHAFKKRMGQSIIGYTNQLRCEYADRLLRSGTLSLSAAGIRAGFSGTEQFLKSYGKLYGKCPDANSNLQKMGRGDSVK